MTQEAVREGTPVSTSDADRVTSRLRQAIVAGDFAPRQRLVETDLIAMFDASRGAVRAALATLTVAGLVEKIRNRGARVRAVELDEALEIVAAVCAKDPERAAAAMRAHLNSVYLATQAYFADRK